MKVLKIIVVLLLLTLLAACQPPTDEEIYYKAQKKLGEMESYQTLAKIYAQRDNGEEQEYLLQQTFHYPNKYRLEVISPEGLKGNLTISNGKIAWIKHPSINQVWRMEQFDQSEEQLIFIGYFMRNLYNSSESKIERKKVDGSDFIIITTSLPGSNYYFYQQKLWIDTKKLVPAELHILDEKGSIRFKVIYEDFIYNPKLDESLFYLTN